MEQKDAALCNLCGETCGLVCTDGERGCEESGLVRTTVTGGYFSTPGNGKGALDDLDAYTFSLCEFCCDWLFCQFKTPPQVQEVAPFEGHPVDEPHPFRPAAVRVRDDEWRQDKERFFAEAHRRSILRLRTA